jgi:hypothetical protein
LCGAVRCGMAEVFETRSYVKALYVARKANEYLHAGAHYSPMRVGTWERVAIYRGGFFVGFAGRSIVNILKLWTIKGCPDKG